MQIHTLSLLAPEPTLIKHLFAIKPVLYVVVQSHPVLAINDVIYMLLIMAVAVHDIHSHALWASPKVCFWHRYQLSLKIYVVGWLFSRTDVISYIVIILGLYLDPTNKVGGVVL